MTSQERLSKADKIINNEVIPLLNDAFNIFVTNFDVLFDKEILQHFNPTLLFAFESYINEIKSMVYDSHPTQVEFVKTLDTLYSLFSDASSVKPTSGVVKKTYNLRPRKSVKYMK